METRNVPAALAALTGLAMVGLPLGYVIIAFIVSLVK
jgi:hypothetical protein